MVVYIITNLVNGKQYIGKTVGSLSRRWSEHRSEAKNGRLTNSALHNAIRKYGEDKFQPHALMSTLVSDEDLRYWEQFLIALMRTKKPRGYNLTIGGDGSVGYRHTEESRQKLRDRPKRTLTEEHKKKISAYQKGRPKKGFIKKKPWTEERRAKVMAKWNGGLREKQRDRQMGSGNTFYGKNHTDETKELIRQARLRNANTL